MPGGQVHIGHVALEQADRHRIVMLPTAARSLAWRRADAPQRRGQRDALLDGGDGVPQAPFGDLPDHGRDIHLRRAGHLAGPEAVAQMIAQQQLQRHAPCLPHLLGLALDHHPLPGHGGA